MDVAGKSNTCNLTLALYPPPFPLFYALLLLSFPVFSLPAVADLMETCIDDVLRAPVVPAETSADEAGPSCAYAPPGATGEDPLGLAEAAARLKQLELESSPLLAAPKNVNVNMAMNNQEDVVKLTEKCGLSSAGGSPVVAALCPPEDLKSNILKAQVEAAALKGSLEEHVVVGDKNCNLQEASARLKVRSGRLGSNSSLSLSSRPEVPESWDLLKSGASAERLANDLHPAAPKVPLTPSESASEGAAPKGKAEELHNIGPLSDNLIDFTDAAPVLPPVQQPKPPITPRWIIPAAAPPGAFTNGLLDLDPPAKVNPLLPADGGAAVTPALPHLVHTHNTISGSSAAPEDGAKPRGLLTTEL